MSNPFATAEAWEPGAGDGSGFMGAGDHECMIVEADGSSTSSGGYPQIVVQVENAAGETIRDWIVVSPRTLGKVNQLIAAAGVRAIEEGDFDPDTLRLSDEYVALLLAKNVGVQVRSEPDYRDPSQTRDRVKAYVPVEDIKKGGGQAAPDFASQDNSDDIPF